MKIFHQGDVICQKYDGKIKGKRIKHNGEFILKHGESGNSHRLIVKEPKDLEIVKDEFGNYYFTLKEKAQLVHEEHKTIEIMPGTYKQYSEREFDYFAKAVVNSRD